MAGHVSALPRHPLYSTPEPTTADRRRRTTAPSTRWFSPPAPRSFSNPPPLHPELSQAHQSVEMALPPLSSFLLPATPSLPSSWPRNMHIYIQPAFPNPSQHYYLKTTIHIPYACAPPPRLKHRSPARAGRVRERQILYCPAIPTNVSAPVQDPVAKQRHTPRTMVRVRRRVRCVVALSGLPVRTGKRPGKKGILV